VAELLTEMPQVPIRINFTPEISINEWQQKFASWRKNHGSRKVLTLLTEIFPRKMAMALLGDTEVIAANWRGADTEMLLEKLINCPFDIIGTDSWDRAMVTRGGVALKDIEPDTLESRLVKGVFFVGEVLDVTGPCGGYNITWALASGKCAGDAAAR
jgi:predicted Rossmann fold flavoprotein